MMTCAREIGSSVYQPVKAIHSIQVICKSTTYKHNVTKKVVNGNVSFLFWKGGYNRYIPPLWLLELFKVFVYRKLG